MTKKHITDEASCACGSGKTFDNCCQPYLDRQSDAATAEALMRSRYTAFTRNDEAYLRYSWHPENCPRTIHIDDCTRWLGLKIIKTLDGGIDDTSGEVEFVARSKINGSASRLHENSYFTRFEGRWVYRDAVKRR